MKLFKNWKSKKQLKLENEALILQNNSMEDLVRAYKSDYLSIKTELDYTRKRLSITPIKIKKVFNPVDYDMLHKTDIEDMIIYELCDFIKPYISFQSCYKDIVNEYEVTGVLNIVGEKND